MNFFSWVVFVHVPLFMIALGCIFGPGYFRPVVLKSCASPLKVWPGSIWVRKSRLENMIREYDTNTYTNPTNYTYLSNEWPVSPHFTYFHPISPRSLLSPHFTTFTPFHHFHPVSPNFTTFIPIHPISPLPTERG